MNQTVLITGTSSGIGKASARLFQERNWNVVATMRDPGKEQELTKLENVLVTSLDVTDPDSIRAAVSAGCERFGSIDVLVNNAGFGVYGPLEASSLDTIRRQFDTNVIGYWRRRKPFCPVFARAGMDSSSTSPPSAESSPSRLEASITGRSSPWKGFRRHSAMSWQPSESR